jgi:hypothetical protein
MYVMLRNKHLKNTLKLKLNLLDISDDGGGDGGGGDD